MSYLNNFFRCHAMTNIAIELIDTVSTLVRVPGNNIYIDRFNETMCAMFIVDPNVLKSERHFTFLINNLIRFGVKSYVREIAQRGIEEKKTPIKELIVKATFHGLIEWDEKIRNLCSTISSIDLRTDRDSIVMSLLESPLKFQERSLSIIKAHYLYCIWEMLEKDEEFAKWHRLVQDLECQEIFEPLVQLDFLPLPAPIISLCNEYAYELPERSLLFERFKRLN